MVESNKKERKKCINTSKAAKTSSELLYRSKRTVNVITSAPIITPDISRTRQLLLLFFFCLSCLLVADVAAAASADVSVHLLQPLQSSKQRQL